MDFGKSEVHHQGAHAPGGQAQRRRQSSQLRVWIACLCISGTWSCSVSWRSAQCGFWTGSRGTRRFQMWFREKAAILEGCSSARNRWINTQMLDACNDRFALNFTFPLLFVFLFFSLSPSLRAVVFCILSRCSEGNSLLSAAAKSLLTASKPVIFGLYLLLQDGILRRNLAGSGGEKKPCLDFVCPLAAGHEFCTNRRRVEFRVQALFSRQLLMFSLVF